MVLKYFTLFSVSCFLALSSISQNTSANSDTLEAAFPGGITAWRNFLVKNLKAEVATDNGAPAGLYTVNMRFVVSADGSLIDIKPLTNHGYGMEKEVTRILKLSGSWLPGSIDGKAVNSYHTQPVTFMVIIDGLEITTKTPNKLFTGTDNEISITADRVKPEHLSVSITNGRIIPLGDRNYKVTVNDTTRRAVITVYNTKKKNEEIGSVSFQVRPKHEAPDAKKD